MVDLITIEKPDMSALASEYKPLVDQAKALVVDSVETRVAALEGYKILKTAIKRIKEHYEPTRKALDTAKKEILLARDKMIAPFEEAMKIVNGKVDVYEQEERRKADEAARIKVETERKRQEDQRLAEAEAAEKAGDADLAAEIIERPIEVTPQVAAPEFAKVKGVSKRVNYGAEVIDLGALLKYAASAPCNYSLVEPVASALNALARQYKEELSIPGVRVVTETVRPVRG